MTIAESLVTECGGSHAGRFEERLNFGKDCSHMLSYKCAKPHGQGVIVCAYPVRRISCETTHMRTADDNEQVKEALRRLMEIKQMKAKPLAKKAGLGETAVRDYLERETSDVKVGTLRKLARALDVSIEDLLGVEQVVITGRVGAGGSVIFDEADGLETAPRPPGIGGNLEALEVVGDSMLPRYSSGDIVYISRVHDGLSPQYFGEFCAIRLVSGETYIKQLSRGSKPGFYTLRSLNAADIEDVEVEWATPIIFVLPRISRGLLAR